MAQTTSLAFFNNKGGVGKTTLSCNMAAQLAEKAALSILYVDCDPQCNATQLLLDDDTWEGLYSNKQKSTNATLLSVFKNIRVGDSTIVTDFPVVRSSRFDIDVLPGHPNLSTLEDTFSSSWIEFKAGQIGAARRSLWAQYLVQAADYDLVIFDTPPIAVVSDAIPLMSQVSGVLVVVRLGNTRRDDATRLHEQLVRLEAPTLGLVINGVSSHASGYRSYADHSPAHSGEPAAYAGAPAVQRPLSDYDGHSGAVRPVPQRPPR